MFNMKYSVGRTSAGGWVKGATSVATVSQTVNEFDHLLFVFPRTDLTLYFMAPPIGNVG